MKTNPMLLIDFYKGCHSDMLPSGITKSISYFTPRSSRVDLWNDVVMFGLQAFCKTYLIDYFNENFFNNSKQDVVDSYKKYLSFGFGHTEFDYRKIEKLFDLGYLPIEVFSLQEGTVVPVGVPMFGITNTHDEFAWLPQALESLISAEIWHPMISATVGHTYRKIVNKYYDISVDDNLPRHTALSDMSFRGQECLQSAIKSSSGWSLSFSNSATVPAIPYLEDNYNCDCEKDIVLKGLVSTEHSVMCSNYAVDGNEESFIKRLLTDIYPNTNFTCVMDSYDYWNVVDNILPNLMTEIMSHNGFIGVRGDSGDCVEVVTNTVFKLWEHFGGTVNSKGYKVLNNKVKAVYGDSITVQRCEEIYKILIEKGFACSNVSLGVGSFSMQCIEEGGTFKPFTRDTFSFAIKATYCEVNEETIPIFKNPKDCDWKKSQKGCCLVYKENGLIRSKDELNYAQAMNNSENLLISTFKDGKMLKENTLKEIRNRLNNERF